MLSEQSAIGLLIPQPILSGIQRSPCLSMCFENSGCKIKDLRSAPRKNFKARGIWSCYVFDVF